MNRLIYLLLALSTWTAQAAYIDSAGREWMQLEQTFAFAGSLVTACNPNCSGIVTQYDYNHQTHSYSNPRSISLDGYTLASKDEAQALMNTAGLFTIGYSDWIATTYSYDAWAYALTSSKDPAGLSYIAYAQEGNAAVTAYFDQGFIVGASPQGPVGGLLYRSQPQGKQCVLDGKVLQAEEQFTAFRAANVSFGQSCVSEVRVCNGNTGIVSGSFTAPSCVAAPAANCSYNGQTILHGQPVSGYTASAANSVGLLGSFCSKLKVTRTCYNGSLGGALYPSCLQTTYNPDRCEYRSGVMKCKSGFSSKSTILSTQIYN